MLVNHKLLLVSSFFFWRPFKSIFILFFVLVLMLLLNLAFRGHLTTESRCNIDKIERSLVRWFNYVICRLKSEPAFFFDQDQSLWKRKPEFSLPHRIRNDFSIDPRESTVARNFLLSSQIHKFDIIFPCDNLLAAAAAAAALLVFSPESRSSTPVRCVRWRILQLRSSGNSFQNHHQIRYTLYRVIRLWIFRR